MVGVRGEEQARRRVYCEGCNRVLCTSSFFRFSLRSSSLRSASRLTRISSLALNLALTSASSRALRSASCLAFHARAS